MNTPLTQPAPEHPFRAAALTAVLDRMAGPYLLFTAVLAGILFVSWLFLLPRFTKVEVSGQKRSAAQIVQYRTELFTRLQESEEIRRKHVLSLYDPQYDFVKALRAEAVGMDRLLSEVEAQAAAVATDDAVHIAHVRYEPLRNRLELQGDVRGVGSRSMTVLAAFADALAKSPLVSALTPPPFTRIDDSAIGPHSPFTIQLTLQ